MYLKKYHQNIQTIVRLKSNQGIQNELQGAIYRSKNYKTEKKTKFQAPVVQIGIQLTKA
jgi:hypothetical protein